MSTIKITCVIETGKTSFGLDDYERVTLVGSFFVKLVCWLIINLKNHIQV